MAVISSIRVLSILLIFLNKFNTEESNRKLELIPHRKLALGNNDRELFKEVKEKFENY